jgi:hypothetical protein
MTFQAIACAVQFDDQHCGIYAGDQDSYEDFKDVFEPLILEYHGLSAGFAHQSDMDVEKIQGNVDPAAPVHSTRYDYIINIYHTRVNFSNDMFPK